MSKCIKNMYPSKIDLTKDECRGVLRRLELDAYSSVVSTFRAQGSLDSSKQSVLDELRKYFHISEDRHKAEIRRVTNNEKLTTISELINGKSYDLEWTREGHRSYPLLCRAPSYTALHMLADHASKFATQENMQLPDPNETKRDRNLVEITGKHITLDDPTKPPTINPTIFGINRKDLKRSIDLVTLHTHTKKKHYHHLKPPPPIPNMKIQHLYQTLNAKRPRKTFTKKSSKTKVSKQSPSRMQFSYPSPLVEGGEKNFDGELQRHLTSQLMPPPPSSSMKYTQQLPTIQVSSSNNNISSNSNTNSNINKNLLKMNHQSLEPQPHYIPNNRLKNEQPTLHQESSRRSKGMSVPSKSNSKYSNGAGSRNNNMDHIPDPQIIFSTTSCGKMEAPESLQSSEVELSPAMTSPLQLLSTAASCTPKLKVITPVNNQPAQQQQLSQPQPSTSSTAAQLPSLSTTQNTQLKVIQNRSIKIIPQQQSQQSSIMTTTTPSKFKIQKIQLVMNKNQDGGTTNISPSATIVSGKAGQLVLSGKSITNTYQVGAKATPYTILSGGTKVGPKVIVQTIDRSFTQKQETPITDAAAGSNERMIPENQRITESTPIDFLPVSTVPTTTTNFPKVIIQKSMTAPKQIKLKLGPGSIVNSKILKGSLPSNLKIQRNVNTKGFTVVNTSQIVQIQSQPSQNIRPITPTAAATAVTAPTTLESTKTQQKESTTDWEQELDDANRTKERLGESNGGAPAAKKPRLDVDEDMCIQDNNIVQSNNDNIVTESADIVSSSNVIYEDENLPQQQKPSSASSNVSLEYVFIHPDDDDDHHIIKPQSDSNQVVQQEIINGDDDSTKINGQFEEVQMQEVDDEELDEEIKAHNGAEAYENLVKSLEADCESEYIKDISDEHHQIEESYGFIDGNMLDTSSAFSRESEGLYQ